MLVGIPKELATGENRVALTPATVKKLAALKIRVAIESGAGDKANFPDEQYVAAGATLCATSQDLYLRCDTICHVNGVEAQRYPYRSGMRYVGLSAPTVKASYFSDLAERGITGFALEKIPRISRAQSMDVLSSQANLAGYKAVLLGVNELHRCVPMFITAAGTIQPAKVLVIGAGVAGLQAIATAKRLGAVTHGFDVRSIVREQIESLGAKFVDLKIEARAEGHGGYAKELAVDDALQLQKRLGEFAANMDLIICTAQIPGKAAPLLLNADALAAMKPGSIIVDLAAASGGNTAATKPDLRVEIGGVSILGPTNVPSLLASDASQLFSNNLFSFLSLLMKAGSSQIDFSDEIINAACFCHDGKLRN